MLLPRRPIRPRNIGTGPQRSSISVAGEALSIRRVPTLKSSTS